MRNCIICRNEYKKTSNRQKYCSKECYNVKLQSGNKFKLEEKACASCNKVFTPQKNHPQAKFCSKKCHKRNYYLERRKFTNKYPDLWKTKKYCRFCNKAVRFNLKGSMNVELMRKYCSSECRWRFNARLKKKHTLKPKNCLYCNAVFVPHYLHPQARFCSTKCNKAHTYLNKYKNIISKYPKGFETIKHCKKCGKRIIFNDSKPLNTELIRTYCSNSCRTKEAHYRFKKMNQQGYKAKVKRRRQTESFKIANRHNAKKRKHFIKNNIITEYTAKEAETLKSKGICFGYGKNPHYVGKLNLQIDHKYPVSQANKDYKKSGTKRIYTLKDIQPLCSECNQNKSDRLK